MAICVFLRGESCGLCVAVRAVAVYSSKVNSESLSAASPCRSQAHPAQAQLGKSPEGCILDLMYLHGGFLAQSPADQVRCRFIAKAWSHSPLWSTSHCKTLSLPLSHCPDRQLQVPEHRLFSSASSQVGFSRGPPFLARALARGTEFQAFKLPQGWACSEIAFQD